MDIVASAPAASESTTASPAMSSSSSTVPATAPTAAVVAAAIASRSLRVRTSSQSGGRQAGEVLNEIQLCPSVMSEGTRKMLPPTTETIQTKPFPIREILEYAL
ncbi:6-phosphofructo-2-kinase/fructose-2,6-bisphosphatase short form [Anopheles darlingi]|uniref:6-phosphofructo-2-kinase/fructose-2, 6-bisphosphatase short form n=1 Tax=Anopheles darlingi TaxID=43151 RepID=W5JUU1_ANODA|nr:6-phosphofructo-2-kinase/fructose-2,6-bisphosphatase short form [Anopheles darlingi]